MPDISYLQELMRQRQDPTSENSPMGAMRALGNSIGNAFQGYEAGKDEQEAISYFAKNDTTPQALEDFRTKHPRMPMVDVYKYASIMGRQRRVNEESDIYQTMKEIATRNNGKIPQAEYPGLLKKARSPEQFASVLKRLAEYKELYPDAKWTEEDPTKNYRESIGGVQTGQVRWGRPNEEKTVSVYKGNIERLETPNEASRLVEEGWTKTPPEKPNETPLYQAIKEKMTQENPATKKLFTASEAYKEIHSKDNEVNVATEIDTILGGMFPGYYTDKETRKRALDYYSTPGGAARVQRLAAQYNKSKAPDIYNFVQTDRGLIPGNMRTGEVGAPATTPEGDNLSKPTPAGEITPLQQIKTLQSALATAESLYDPSFVGPVAGRLAAVGRSVLGGAGQTDKQIIFNAALNQARNSLVYLLSGKQINEQEYKRLETQMPSSTLTPKSFVANMTEFKRTLGDILTNKEGTLKAGGYGAGSTSPAPNNEYKVGDLYQGKKIRGINRATKQLNIEGLGVVSY